MSLRRDDEASEKAVNTTWYSINLGGFAGSGHSEFNGERDAVERPGATSSRLALLLCKTAAHFHRPTIALTYGVLQQMPDGIANLSNQKQ